MKILIGLLILALTNSAGSSVSAEYLPTNEQVRQAVAHTLSRGVTIPGDPSHHGALGFQVGKSHQDENVAIFWLTADKQHHWGLEEWRARPDGRFRWTKWEFHNGHAFTQEFIVDKWMALTDVRRRTQIFPGSAEWDEATVKSELTWEILSRAGIPL